MSAARTTLTTSAFNSDLNSPWPPSFSDWVQGLDTPKLYPFYSPPKRATASAPLSFCQNNSVVLPEQQWGASGGTLGRAADGVRLCRIKYLHPIVVAPRPTGVEVGGAEKFDGMGSSSCAYYA